jgi:3-oxoadipyl-CoA thiolase
MLNAYLYAGTRTPFGRHSGVLAGVRPDDLLAGVIRSVLESTKVDPHAIEDVMVGCANQAGEDSRCIARHAALLSGLPIEVGGTVMQRNCGSGLDAVISAAHAITSNEAELIMSGGVESMSRAPFVVGKAEVAYTRDLRWYDSALGARFPNPRVEKEFGDDTMPQTADNLAQQFGITREQADTFALASQMKCEAARQHGLLAAQITPVTITDRKGNSNQVSVDEHPRANVTLESLAKLKAINSGGVTTAGNASGLNDGAVALLIGSQAAGAAHGLTPRARIIASGVAGVDPKIMGFGPVPAGKKALARAGLSLKDMDVIEINEAFAAQVLGCLKGFDLALDDPRVNPHGGAIALGHPLGASGPRILLNAVQYLEKTGGRYGLVSMCIGLGQGIAVVIERV